ncbi:hypothetical protein M0P65_02305 [Candidatus Gracilibacteria bacterium]|nr:hypothetical protein [Candidatus Gracilibacteria bacterium]
MSIKDKILGKIKKEEVKPTSVGYFITKKYLQIGALIFLLFVGILLTMLFMSDFGENMRFFNLRYFHFPLLWILIIFGIGFFAFKDFQNTGKGYKYPIGWIIGTIIAIFIFVGFLGYRFGVGHNMNNYMGSHMRGYRDFTLGQQMWKNPSEGRMGGIIEEIKNDKIIISNIRGDKFSVTLSGSANSSNLNIGDRVKIIGQKTGTGEFIATEIINSAGMGGGMMGGRGGRGMMNWR